MPTGSEVATHRNIGRIADALERIADALALAPDPPAAPDEKQAAHDEWDALRPLVEGRDVLPQDVLLRTLLLARKADALGITPIQQWAHKQQVPTSYKP